MLLTAWNNGAHHLSGAGYGLKMSALTRDRYFNQSWATITLELPGQSDPVEIDISKKSFWSSTCRELVSQDIGKWLISNNYAPWIPGLAPQFLPEKVGEQRFRLIEDSEERFPIDKILQRQKVKPAGLLYRFYKHEYGYKALKEKRLRITQAKDLNDPFELSGIYVSDPNMQNYLGEQKKNFLKYSGLLCFSENWTDLIMWAHYADAHKGLCLGFDVSGLPVLKVNYREKQPLVDRDIARLRNYPATHDDNSEDLPLHFFLTKSKDWQYEKEWRCFIDLVPDVDGNTYEYFSGMIKLKEVIIGLHSEETVKNIREITNKISHDIDVYEARKMTGHFALEKYWIPE